MAITSELIGRLGGGVEEIPVSASGLSGSGGTSHLLARIEVSGRALIAVDIRVTNASSTVTYQPMFSIGSTNYGRTGRGTLKEYEIVSDSTDVGLKTYSGTSTNAVDLDGIIYVAKL